MSQAKKAGFQTSSTALQDAFEVVKTELSKKRANWEAISDAIAKAVSPAISSINLDDPDSIDANKTQALFMVFVMGGITQIGIELNETHERLAKVEKMVKELKLACSR